VPPVGTAHSGSLFSARRWEFWPVSCALPVLQLKKHRKRDQNITSEIIEADFFTPPAAEAKQKQRILIIDNNRDFTYSAKVALERTGRYLVWEENESTRADQTAQRVRPDLILLDIAMPETDGGEVAARIESDPMLQRSPIVFLTALVMKAEARSGLHIQGHPFLAKPISIPELIDGIERNLPAHAGF